LELARREERKFLTSSLNVGVYIRACAFLFVILSNLVISLHNCDVACSSSVVEQQRSERRTTVKWHL